MKWTERGKFLTESPVYRDLQVYMKIYSPFYQHKGSRLLFGDGVCTFHALVTGFRSTSPEKNIEGVNAKGNRRVFRTERSTVKEKKERVGRRA